MKPSDVPTEDERRGGGGRSESEKLQNQAIEDNCFENWAQFELKDKRSLTADINLKPQKRGETIRSKPYVDAHYERSKSLSSQSKMQENV